MIRFDNVSFTYSGADSPTLRRRHSRDPRGRALRRGGRDGDRQSPPSCAPSTVSSPTSAGASSAARSPSKADRPATTGPATSPTWSGYVGQNPVASFVTERVEDELAYTMENLGVPPDAMRAASRTRSISWVSTTCARPAVAHRCRVANSSVLPSVRCSRRHPACSSSTSPRPPSIRLRPRRCSTRWPGWCTTSV